ncbi:S8 family serine peptidase [Niallia sp. RD1]|uniref:S8 family serine peptidase n=1 Tax=Niallia sp. RD1 TaxID=2962858 RepID=UPI0020C196E3|nr:S8 family serine peptidase [Niallia sp. RD1]UTI41004.1 S8 family serine peptidase [Niallia sp. RD1]
MIAAAGNENTMQPSYPAAFSKVLSVAAVSYTGQRAPFSNYGDYIDVAAPGVQIPSTYFNQQYAALRYFYGFASCGRTCWPLAFSKP